MSRMRHQEVPEETRGTLRIWMSRQSLVRLARLTRGYRLQAAATVLAMILLAASGLAGPYLLKIAIDDGIGAGNPGMLTLAALLYLGASLLGGLFNGLQTYGVQWVGDSLVRDLTEQLSDYSVSHDITFFAHPCAVWNRIRFTNA